jgi:hypothetical protein
MPANNLTSELLEKMGLLIQTVVSIGRTFLSEVIRLSVCAGSGGVGRALLTLAVFTILCAGDPTPTPTPTPIPF